MAKNRSWHKAYKKGYRARYPNEDVIRFIQKNFPEKKARHKRRILDFGCGTGRHIVYLAKEGFDVFGVEIAESGIELTKNWVKKERLAADLRKIEGIALPFPDGYFDAIIDCAAVQHNKTNEIIKIFNEFYRVLKKGGKIFSLCKSTKDSLNGIGRRVESRTFYFNKRLEADVTIHFFTKAELKSLLGKYREIEIEYTMRTIDRMQRKIAHYVICANK